METIQNHYSFSENEFSLMNPKIGIWYVSVQVFRIKRFYNGRNHKSLLILIYECNSPSPLECELFAHWDIERSINIEQRKRR